ncbi:Tribbles-like protein 2 [Lamellibrachia satsuma]|nr:Tribbles-like protein 2 [Lamellibrachia satsuma]
MSSHAPRPRPRIVIPPRKHVEYEQPPSLGSGYISPDLQPNTPPTFPGPSSEDSHCGVSKIGRYLLTKLVDTVGIVDIYDAYHCDTQQEYVCKVIPLEKYRSVLAPYWQTGSHKYLNEIEEIILGETKTYVFFARHYGDLHSYVRQRRRLKEHEASRLFLQIVFAVLHCHESGVVLRDLKLRKFVFKNPQRTQLKLESLEDAYVLEDENDDRLMDKHGCPAYVSPEILTASHSYSGRAADTWSLGVMAYTMLIGRYPFHDVEPSTLFTKIRRGQYSIPDTISSRAKCLIRSLLRHEPTERLTADQILQHPWFTLSARISCSKKASNADQTVPDFASDKVEEEPFFV